MKRRPHDGMADVADLKSVAGKTRREGSSPPAGTSMLPGIMGIAVPLWINEYQKKGGPTDEDRKRATEFSAVLGSKGDILLHGGKPGEAAEMFNRTAESVAILAFIPGGVNVFGRHFEVK